MIVTQDPTTATGRTSVRITATTTAVGEVLAIHDRLVEGGALLPIPLSAAIEQLRQATRLEAPLSLPPLMTVRVLDSSGAVTTPRSVTIPAVCPACSGPRSTELVEVEGYRHGIAMKWDTWRNPCGHLDTPDIVLREARRYDELVRSQIGGE